MTLANAVRKPTRRALAVMNVARLRLPLDHPSMKEFQSALGPINEIARNTPGFLWMYDSDDDNSNSMNFTTSGTEKSSVTGISPSAIPEMTADAMLMPQLSLWENLHSLQHFVFKSGHAMYYRRKREWFVHDTEEQQKLESVHCNYPTDNVLWHAPWCDTSRPPTLIEAFDKLRRIRSCGPSADAFDLKSASKYCDEYS